MGKLNKQICVHKCGNKFNKNKHAGTHFKFEFTNQ